MPEEYKLLTIFVDVFEGYFRHLSHILAETGLMQEDVFWELVAASRPTRKRIRSGWPSTASTTCTRRT